MKQNDIDHLPTLLEQSSPYQTKNHLFPSLSISAHYQGQQYHNELLKNEYSRKTIQQNYDITDSLLHKLQNKHSQHFKTYMDKKKLFMINKFNNVPTRLPKNNKKIIQTSKMKKIFVPKLKQFTDLNYEQYQRESNIERKEYKKQVKIKQQLTKNRFKEQSKINQIQNSQIKQQFIEKNKIKFNHRHTDRQKTSQIFTDRIKRSPKFNKEPYYEYIQNYQHSKGEIKQKKQRKLAKESDEYNKSLSLDNSQFQKPNNNTIFHKCKIKLKSSFIAKNQKSQSSISNIFSVPISQSEQQQFLLNYCALNPAFNIKDLIKKENFDIINQFNHIYFGQTNLKGKHGLGILLSNKSIFQGIFKNNEKYKGFEKHSQGLYQGEFKNNKRDGYGIFLWKNGQKYQGDWKNGQKSGHGIWKSPNGNFYDGQWKQNKQNGKGYYDYGGKSKYRGYFKDFLKHGRGQQEFNNGDKYIGNYENGKPHGYGKYIFSNGDIYEGQFFEGSRQGKGILILAEGGSYQGQFLEDMKHGKGIQKSKEGQVFQGEFKQNERDSGILYSKKRQIIETI